MVLMNLFAGQQWRHKHREQIYGHGAGVGEEEEGGTNEETGMEAYTLPCVKQIASGNLLCDTGSSSWYSMKT